MKMGLVLMHIKNNELLIKETALQEVKNKEELTELFASILDSFSFEDNQDLDSPPW